MIISNEDLLTFAESVWSSILDMKLLPGDDDATTSPESVIACVQVTGDWEGAVTVRCSKEQASNMAAAMFGMDAADLSEEEIRDAMGEIANMVGGNVKGLAPGTNTLALPTVARGDETAITITKSKQVNRVVGMTEDEAIVFTVFSRQD